MRLALTQPTGKLGSATLTALLTHKLLPPTSLVLSTSSPPDSPNLSSYASQGITIHQANYNDPDSLTLAWTGCTHLFLVSSPSIALDFHDAPSGSGREKHHISAIRAAHKAGVRHIYYTSLAFGSNSKAGVMVAHNRTEAFLEEFTKPGGEGHGMSYTIIREGLYSESWPLYFGQYFEPGGEERSVVPLCGDGRISWTSIADLGLANALVLSSESGGYAGKTFYLSTRKSAAITLRELAGLVSEIRGRKVEVELVGQQEYERYCVQERGQDEGMAKWWSKSYLALEDGECEIDDGMLEELLASRGQKAKPFEETLREMLRKKE